MKSPPPPIRRLSRSQLPFPELLLEGRTTEGQITLHTVTFLQLLNHVSPAQNDATEDTCQQQASPEQIKFPLGSVALIFWLAAAHAEVSNFQKHVNNYPAEPSAAQKILQSVSSSASSASTPQHNEDDMDLQPTNIEAEVAGVKHKATPPSTPHRKVQPTTKPPRQCAPQPPQHELVRTTASKRSLSTPATNDRSSGPGTATRVGEATHPKSKQHRFHHLGAHQRGLGQCRWPTVWGTSILSVRTSQFFVILRMVNMMFATFRNFAILFRVERVTTHKFSNVCADVLKYATGGPAMPTRSVQIWPRASKLTPRSRTGLHHRCLFSLPSPHRAAQAATLRRHGC